MNINSVNKKKVSEIFAADSDKIYKIPKYQREYTWGVNEWDTLFNDIKENDEGYFLGSIICIDSENSVDHKYEVVDGQQRLITLSIFIAAIYNTLLSMYDSLSERQKINKITPIRNELVINDTEKIRVIPQDQCNNRSDFTGLITKEIILATEEIVFKNKINTYKALSSHAGNRRIEKAYKHFKKCIDTVLEKSSDKVSELFKIHEKINSAIFVMIEVSNHADAYTLFESLNNRGTPLTSVDLIKNILLARLDGSGVGDMDSYFSRWKEILSNLGEKYSDQERFFRQNYNAFRKSLNAPFCKEGSRQQYPLGTIATRTTMLDIYEQIIHNSPVKALDGLLENSTIYAGIILPKKDNLSGKQYEAYLELQRVQGAPSYLFIMYLLKYQDILKVSDDDIVDICKVLVNFFIRRNMTDIPPTYDLTRIFMMFIEDIERKGYRSTDIYTNLLDTLRSASAPDKIFEEKLRGPVYKNNFDATRFILCMIAKRDMTRETKQDLWEQTSAKQYVWSIEHIFPQGKDIPDYWVDMIADGNREKAEEYQETYVHTLGNLTLTAYNSKLSNKSFNEKKELQENGKFVGFRNTLNLNDDVRDKDKWTVEAIKARTERMIKEILEIFKLQ